jgi:hypothetical protein
VFSIVLWWVFLLDPVALQWLRGFGKKSARRCLSDLGFIKLLNRIFISSYSLPPPLVANPVL